MYTIRGFFLLGILAGQHGQRSFFFFFFLKRELGLFIRMGSFNRMTTVCEISMNLQSQPTVGHNQA